MNANREEIVAEGNGTSGKSTHTVRKLAQRAIHFGRRMSSGPLALGLIAVLNLMPGSLGAQSVYTPYIFTTLAGLASPGSADGTGSAARFWNPEGVATDSSGNVYVADAGNNTIRKGFLPQLTILLSGVPPSGIVLTWPTNAVGFTLQSTTNLVSPAVWSTNSPAPVVIAGQNTVTNPISGPQQFFRLVQ